MAVLFVTYDVGVAAEIFDRIAVMYDGRIVEQGPVVEVIEQPRHRDTRPESSHNLTHPEFPAVIM